MAEKDLKNSSNFKSKAWTAMAPAWKMTSDLWESPLAIRDKGQEYLTQFKKEDPDKFAARLKNSVFLNEFRGAIETMAGMVFRSDPKPDELHAEIEALMTDIDLCGNSFWAFNDENFQLFLRDGNGFIFVDASQINPAAAEAIKDGRRPTLAEREGDRVFWTYFTASQVINSRYEKQGSRQVLTKCTVEISSMEPDGEFGEKEVKKHLVLTPGRYEFRTKSEETGEFDTIDGPYETGLDFIPLVPCAKENSQPPMLTLGMLNIQHYNKTSDYDEILHLVCVPLRIDKYDNHQDATTAGKMEIAAPGVGRKIWGEHASITYAEVEGKGLERVELRYKDIEQAMAKIGVGMFAPSNLMQVRTATEVADTAGARQSKLAGYARQWVNAIEKALYLTVLYINAIKGPKTIDEATAEKMQTMPLKVDYDRLTFSQEQLQFFSDMVDSGKLSLQTFLEWLPQVADMPPEFSPKDEMKRIAAVNTVIDDDEPKDPDDDPEGTGAA